ncbi:helix-turn-helix transcriptional regulator [Arachnia propionica]|uniref:helix-turn-helix transcriptional regulator n=1 Tax=Arachnia propionica TaxID=1750 RepID=UPI003C6ED92D
MSAAMQETDNSTRERVVRSILEHGPSTARELAERLNLTPAAIRRHLSALLEEGTLGSREQRVYGARGRGRPSKVFFLTDAGRSEFHQAYDELAIVAIRRLVEAAGPQAMVDLASERVDEIESRFNELREAHPERTPIELLTEALGATYAPSVKPVRSGDQLCQHHCPVAHVAAEFPQLCEVETQLFSRLLGSHVQRLATIAHGDGVCTTHVPNPVIPSKIRK